MKNNQYTLTDIADRFEEAAATLKRLPPAFRKQRSCFWPEIIRDLYEKMNEEKLPLRLGPPSSAAISRMEEVMGWIFLLDDEKERKIIWLRAEKIRWKQICWRMGYGKTKTRDIWTSGLMKIYYQLNH